MGAAHPLSDLLVPRPGALDLGAGTGDMPIRLAFAGSAAVRPHRLPRRAQVSSRCASRRGPPRRLGRGQARSRRAPPLPRPASRPLPETTAGCLGPGPRAPPAPHSPCCRLRAVPPVRSAAYLEVLGVQLLASRCALLSGASPGVIFGVQPAPVRLRSRGPKADRQMPRWACSWSSGTRPPPPRGASMYAPRGEVHELSRACARSMSSLVRYCPVRAA